MESLHFKIASLAITYLNLSIKQEKELEELEFHEHWGIEKFIQDRTEYHLEMRSNSDSNSNDEAMTAFLEKEYENYHQDPEYGEVSFDEWKSIQEDKNQNDENINEFEVEPGIQKPRIPNKFIDEFNDFRSSFIIPDKEYLESLKSPSNPIETLVEEEVKKFKLELIQKKASLKSEFEDEKRKLIILIKNSIAEYFLENKLDYESNILKVKKESIDLIKLLLKSDAFDPYLLEERDREEEIPG